MPLSLLGFPKEVVLRIISLTANADLDSFTLTCTAVRNLATGALCKHQERKIVYSALTYGDREAHDERTTWIHPTLMLRDLLAHDLLCYPTELSIYDHQSDYIYWDDGRDYDRRNGTLKRHDEHQGRYSDVDRALESFPTNIGPLVERSPYLNGHDRFISGVLEEGCIGATLGFLITLLPNLTTLHVIDYNEKVRTAEADSLGIVFVNVLQICYSPTIGPIKATPPLSKLSHLTLTRSDKGRAGDSFGLSMYAPIFYLPSMRSIYAQYIRPWDIWDFPGFSSNIENLIFHDSEVRAEAFITYLKDTKNLRQFRCQFGVENMFEDYRGFIPSTIMPKLLRCAGHSLRGLELGGDIYSAKLARGGAHYIGSLKGFQVLRTIRIQSTMFIEPLEPLEILQGNRWLFDDTLVTQGRPRKLIDMIPSSAVRIRFGIETKNDVAVAMLHGLPEGKAELLPNLESVEFEGRDTFKAEDEPLLLACRNASVEIKEVDLMDEDDELDEYRYRWT